ncbi:histidine kinase N-terminal 7TM domain-containing protein [Oceanobacillus sojae]|uniref:histidine kinase N-terminal 7TM domain-containing diguanylate cyclase n=1 Tax=Oceanobacillus sojae TaxID=582851 RepID=UPI0021A7380D|nr:histidine kinase N-terminal 7TM domain-containing protein [Oceanobacillus sojae]MCT1901619.1 diguanylate cyclase [Oceanobacillus sojae]
MGVTVTAYIAIMSASGVFNLYLAILSYLRRHYYKRIGQIFIIYTGTVTIYCFAAAFGLLSTTLEQVKIWTVIQYIGIAFAPLLGLLFILRYFGMEKAFKRTSLLLIVPAVTVAMVATSDFHHLHYRSLEFHPVLGAPYIEQVIGPWYIVHGMFIFACMFIALCLTLFQLRSAALIYRKQIIILALGQCIPILLAFLYLIGLSPAGFDSVPLYLWLTSILYFWAITSSSMFTLVPVAKDVIFQRIADAVIVLDDSSRLIEFNQAAKQLFTDIHENMYGQDFYAFWKGLTDTDFSYDLSKAPLTVEMTQSLHQKNYVFHLRISNLSISQKNSGVLLIFTDITEMKKLQNQLEYFAYYDELTNIFNRRAFFKYTKDAFREAEKQFTVILFDIDYFKYVNDTYGHHSGDLILSGLSRLIQEITPAHSIFARYGGEEFVLALPGSSVEEGLLLAEMIRRKVETHLFPTEDGSITITISMGAAGADLPDGECTLEELLNRADKALYAAKESGRNQVQADKDVLT